MQPMTNSSGKVKKCLIGGCNEFAFHGPWRKQRCKAHGASMVEKRKIYDERRRSAPRCNSCGVEPLIGDFRLELGICQDCEKQKNELNAECEKQREFDEAFTVDDLKSWITRYML